MSKNENTPNKFEALQNKLSPEEVLEVLIPTLYVLHQLSPITDEAVLHVLEAYDPMTDKLDMSKVDRELLMEHVLRWQRDDWQSDPDAWKR